jgi:hypothetical protein
VTVIRDTFGTEILDEFPTMRPRRLMLLRTSAVEEITTQWEFLEEDKAFFPAAAASSSADRANA